MPQLVTRRRRHRRRRHCRYCIHYRHWFLALVMLMESCQPRLPLTYLMLQRFPLHRQIHRLAHHQRQASLSMSQPHRLQSK